MCGFCKYHHLRGSKGHWGKPGEGGKWRQKAGKGPLRKPGGLKLAPKGPMDTETIKNRIEIDPVFLRLQCPNHGLIVFVMFVSAIM